MSVTLLEVWRAARARSVPFSGESAGFAALALCEATQHSPRSLALTDAELGEDGTVRLLSSRTCSQQQADKEIRTLLGRLLEVSSSPGPSLFRVAGRGGGTSLPGLADEIEKALIPLNRAAARRALVRLHRETARAVEQGRLAPAPDLDEPAQIRLSPPAPPVAPTEAAPRSLVTSPPAPPPVAEKPEARVRRESPPPLPVASPIPVVVACETPPPAPRPVPVRIPEPPPPLALASREPTLPLKLPLSVPAAEVEQLTSAETIVARRARGLPTPPPLPPSRSPSTSSERTPPMGSVDVAVIGVSPPLPALADSPADATERVPPVSETDGDESLDALASWPLSSPRAPSLSELEELEVEPELLPSRSLPSVEPRAESVAAPDVAPVFPAEAEEQLSLPLPSFELSADLSPDLPTAEPPKLRESPALVVGVHVADSDERAEPVGDDELETRPLPSALEALPVEPIRHILAPQSDVRELLSEFKVQEGLSENELRRELKALAGVDLTPGTPLNVGPR